MKTIANIIALSSSGEQAVTSRLEEEGNDCTVEGTEGRYIALERKGMKVYYTARSRS